jgi:hypothetical protein
MGSRLAEWLTKERSLESAERKTELIRRAVMLNSQALCLQILEIYPDIGACGIDVKVDYDDQQSRWVVHLSKGDKQLKTYLEPADAKKCMQGHQCVGLALEVNQLKDSLDRMPVR